MSFCKSISLKKVLQNLKDSDIDEKTGDIIGRFKTGITTILIYADWCHHCEELKLPLCKSWIQISLNSDIHFVCSESKDSDIFKKLEANKKVKTINGFPTILKYFNGKFVRKYDGDRTEKKLLEFMLSEE